MNILRLESGEILFDVIRGKFNALAEAVERLDKLESATPLLDVIDTGAGKLLQWNGASPCGGAVPESSGAAGGYAGPFCVTLSGGTASVKNGADPESQYAGEVIIGTTHHSMPTGTLAAGTGTVIYLTVYYSTALPGLVYAFNSSLSTAVLGSQGWYCELARVTAAGLIQTHWGGNIEISGRWM